MAVSNGTPYDRSHLYMQIATDDAGYSGFDMREEEDLPKRSFCQDFVEMLGFQMFIGLVIMANAIVIGLETDIASEAVLWQQLEDFFLLIFLLELLLKLCVYGCSGFFRSNNPDVSWNIFDFTIVGLGVTDRGLTHLAHVTGNNVKGGGARFIVLLLRTFRLLRLLRIIRIFRLMKQLYLLAHSILEAFSAVIWVSILCVLIIYICAVVITRLVGQPATDGVAVHNFSNPATDQFRIENFGSVLTSMLTLFRLMTFPDMEKYKPVYDLMPGLCGFFIAFIVFMGFAIVSLLTGVITESLLDKGKKREDERRFDRERSRRLLAEDVRRAFQERDTTGSGFLNRHQFEKCKVEVIRLCHQHQMLLRPKDLDALFELVDDGSGSIDSEELLYGMVQLNSEVRPMAVMELRRLVVRGIHGVSEQLAAMDSRMQMMDRRMIELQAAARFGALNPSAAGLPPAPAAPPNFGAMAPMSAPIKVDLLGSNC